MEAGVCKHLRFCLNLMRLILFKKRNNPNAKETSDGYVMFSFNDGQAT